MKSTVFIGWIFLLIANANAVLELTDANFYDYAKDKDVLLVDFFAPWCSDCKNLDPDLEKAAYSLGRRSSDLVKVDCFGSGKGLCDTYGVHKYPTLKNFARGTFTGDYNGALTGDAISGYINTFEGSNVEQSSPGNAYAMSQPATASQPVCTKCKIAKTTKEKGVPVSTVFSPSKEMMNVLQCAKCKLPTPPGAKINEHCTESVRRQCIESAPKSQRQASTAYTSPAASKQSFDSLSPLEALKLPYDINDKKRSMKKSTKKNKVKKLHGH